MPESGWKPTTSAEQVETFIKATSLTPQSILDVAKQVPESFVYISRKLGWDELLKNDPELNALVQAALLDTAAEMPFSD